MLAVLERWLPYTVTILDRFHCICYCLMVVIMYARTHARTHAHTHRDTNLNDVVVRTVECRVELNNQRLEEVRHFKLQARLRFCARL